MGNDDSGVGFVTIHYEYTCGLGIVEPPIKDQWKLGAAMVVQYTIPNVPEWPTILRLFDFQHNKTNNVSLKGYDYIAVVGDSLMDQFASALSHKKSMEYVKYRSKMNNNSKSLKTMKQCAADGVNNLIIKNNSKNNGDSSSSKRLVFLANSFVWDVIADEQGLPRPQVRTPLASRPELPSRNSSAPTRRRGLQQHPL